MKLVRAGGASAALAAAVVVGAASGSPDAAVTPQAPAPGGRVPEHTLIVKGAWASASDSTTPLPEGGRWGGRAYRNDYFGLALDLSERWQAGLEGAPPSDSGAYVLAQVVPSEGFRSSKPGHLLITAQDMFFTSTQASNALELINFTRDHLDASVYTVEEAPREMTLGQRAFVRFAYQSSIADMHWTVLATEVRCHVLELIFVSTAPRKMTELLKSLSAIRLGSTGGVGAGTDGGETPLCIKDYANADNLLERTEPVLSEPRYNPIPVRILIDREGRVKHIHFLRAFPDQAQAITAALLRWRFKPHLVDGHPVEVETGVVFGRKTQPTAALAPGPRALARRAGVVLRAQGSDTLTQVRVAREEVSGLAALGLGAVRGREPLQQIAQVLRPDAVPAHPAEGEGVRLALEVPGIGGIDQQGRRRDRHG